MKAVNMSRFWVWSTTNAVCRVVHYGLAASCPFHITVTPQWARWRLKSPAPRLFTQPFIRAQINENIKAPCHWSLCGEFTDDRWIPRTNASNTENVFIWWRHYDTVTASDCATWHHYQLLYARGIKTLSGDIENSVVWIDLFQTPKVRMGFICHTKDIIDILCAVQHIALTGPLFVFYQINIQEENGWSTTPNFTGAANWPTRPTVDNTQLRMFI